MTKRFWTVDFEQIYKLLRVTSRQLQKHQENLDEQRRWWEAIGIPRRHKKDTTGYFIDRRQLHAVMSKAFNNDDIIAVCMSLGVDWENLKGANKELKVWSLIDHMERRSELYKLLDECRTRRPNYEWPLV